MLIKQDLSRFDLSSIKHASITVKANPEYFANLKKRPDFVLWKASDRANQQLLLPILQATVTKIGSMGKPVPIYDVHLLDSDGNDVKPEIPVKSVSISRMVFLADLHTNTTTVPK